jgi:hypothetical protein
VVNDLAVGSAFLLPGDRVPSALYFAAPVVRVLQTPPVAFYDRIWGLIRLWNPNLARGYAVDGGGWRDRIEWPAGVVPGWAAPLEDRLRMPAETWVTASQKRPLQLGDLIFYRPAQSEALANFRTIYALKKGKILETWAPYPALN